MKKILRYLLLSSFVVISYSSCDKEEDLRVNLSMEEMQAFNACTETLDEPYGICAHITRKATDYPYIDGILDLMDDLNITWIRSDMDWYAMSKTPGNELDFSLFDDVFSHLDKHPNIHLLPIISPDNINFPHADSTEISVKTYNEDWKSYVKGVVSRYQDKCPVWEGFNEWDQYLNKGFMSYEEGIEYQKAIYDITKGINPDLNVLAGSICSVQPTYRNLSVMGYYGYSDINNQHSYVTMSPEATYDQWVNIVNNVDKALEANRPLWLTEFGYSTSTTRISEAEQAMYIPRAYITSFAKGINKAFLYSMRSKEYEDDEPEDHFGITHKDLSLKPAYYALRNLTRMLPSGSTRPIIQNGGSIYLASWIHPQLGKVYAIWSSDGKKNVSLYFEGSPHFYSYSDIENEMDVTDYSVFEIGPGVIYITGLKSLEL